MDGAKFFLFPGGLNSTSSILFFFWSGARVSTLAVPSPTFHHKPLNDDWINQAPYMFTLCPKHCCVYSNALKMEYLWLHSSIYSHSCNKPFCSLYFACSVFLWKKDRNNRTATAKFPFFRYVDWRRVCAWSTRFWLLLCMKPSAVDWNSKIHHQFSILAECYCCHCSGAVLTGACEWDSEIFVVHFGIGFMRVFAVCM